MDYQFLHLKDPTSSNPLALLAQIKQLTQQGEGLKHWGLFPGLFGLGTNEVYWLANDAALTAIQNTELQVLQRLTLRPTVRPKSFVPRDQPGVYVFRWFEVSEAKIDEVVRLSNEAWESFEGGFDTEVQGLFTVDGQSPYSMVLVTWYKDLAVWQASREPAPEARQNFAARQALLDSARPIATRLERL
jgi:hypothetical protein